MRVHTFILTVAKQGDGIHNMANGVTKSHIYLDILLNVYVAAKESGK